MPGQPANLLSGVSDSSVADAGNKRITNFTTMPFLPSEELES
jgi:hypothetical protein